MRDVLMVFYFLCVFLFISGLLYFFIMFDKRMERRLNYYLDIDKKYKSLRKKKDKIKVDSFSLKNINELIRGKLSERDKGKAEQILKSAGVKMSAEEYIMLRWVLASTFGGILYLLSGNVVFLPLGAIIGYVTPKMWINKKRGKRIQSFNDALPDMITTIIGSLRSGYSFTQALKTVSEECESPVKEEITILLKEMSYGIPMEEALNNLSQRMPSNDLELMLQAILIQRQVGGNLSEVLEIIVKTIRDRNKLERQVQALTAQGRLSGKVIGCLPIVLGLVIYLINPEYMRVLFTNTIGIIIMVAGVISGAIGFVLINKLTQIEV
jgi:tight adherence protein B